MLEGNIPLLPQKGFIMAEEEAKNLEQVEEVVETPETEEQFAKSGKKSNKNDKLYGSLPNRSELSSKKAPQHHRGA